MIDSARTVAPSRGTSAGAAPPSRLLASSLAASDRRTVTSTQASRTGAPVASLTGGAATTSYTTAREGEPGIPPVARARAEAAAVARTPRIAWRTHGRPRKGRMRESIAAGGQERQRVLVGRPF